MGIDIEPSVSLLIAELRKIPNDLKKSIILYEMKKMAARSLSSDESVALDLWKKLYLIHIGVKLNDLDFIKACGSPCLLIKRIGYQGITYIRSSKNMLLMQNTLSKDLKNEYYCSEALIFISNILDPSNIFLDISNSLILPNESNKHFAKYLVSISKYNPEMFFELKSEKSINLFVKLQIILDNHLEEHLTYHCFKYLIDSLSSSHCPYTKCKIIEILQKLIKKKNFILEDDAVAKIKSFVFGPDVKLRKQIDIAICIQSIRLLALASIKWERIEEFILNLINSKSLNSRYLGFGLAVEFKINPEISISKLIEYGLDRQLYFNSLYDFIDQTTYKYIYLQIRMIGESPVTLKIIKRLCDFGDQEFICKALFDYPNLYELIRNSKILNREQCKGFFKMVLEQDNPQFFLMIYDLFPAKAISEKLICEIGTKHISNICKSLDQLKNSKLITPKTQGQSVTPDETSVFHSPNFSKEMKDLLFVFDNLINFLCLQGNQALNRLICIEYLCLNLSNGLDPVMKSQLIDGILRFNLILDQKMIHLENSDFVEYHVEGDVLTLSYFDNLKRSNNISVTFSNRISSEIKNMKLTEKFGIRKNSVIEIVNESVIKYISL
jgi:hypothetical protein